MRAYSCRRRQAVDLHDHPLVRARVGDDEPLVGGHEVLRLELRERQRGGDQDEDGRVGREAAVPVDERALEAQAVAGGASDQRDRRPAPAAGSAPPAPRARKAVHEQEREGALPAAGDEVAERGGAGSRAKATPSAIWKAAEVAEMADRGGADLGREAHAGDAVVATAERADLAGGRAADHGHAGEAARHRRRQRLAVVVAGAEEEHERDVLAARGRRAAPPRPRGGRVHTTARCEWSAPRPQAVPHRLGHGGPRGSRLMILRPQTAGGVACAARGNRNNNGRATITAKRDPPAASLH